MQMVNLLILVISLMEMEKLIQSYSDELIQDIAKLRDDVNQAYCKFW